MKNLKKLVSLLLALVMVLSLTVTASAYTIELDGAADKTTAGHTYNVYQIFKGELAYDKVTNKPVLSNIVFGANYHPDVADNPETTDVNEAKAYVTGDAVPENILTSIGTTSADARDFAEKILDKNTANGEVEGTPFKVLDSTNEWKVTGIEPGYYLIVDNGTPAAGDSYSAYIVEVVEDVAIAPKSGTIVPDKKINADNHNDDNNGDDSVITSGTSSNGTIGSVVNYTLTVKIPLNAANYSYYYCVLNDTLSKGLTLNEDIIVGYDTDGDGVIEEGETKLTEGTDYKLYTGQDATDAATYAQGKTFQIAMLNAKDLGGKTITVNYSATINKDAEIGVEGNPNKFDVQYSNNPNYDYKENPTTGDGRPDNDTSIPIGKTPEKETITYVTGIKLMKTDGTNPLTGAEFEISGESVKTILVSGTDYVPATEGATHWELNDGKFTTQAPQLTDTWKEKAANDRDGGYVKNGDSYTVATDDQLKDTSIKLYAKVLANGYLYKNPSSTPTHKAIEVQEEVKVTDTIKAKAFVDNEGILVFEGLAEGIFTIKEITTPAGYNTIEDITLVIDWTAPVEGSTDKKCTWTATADGKAVSYDPTEDIFELEIENKAGSTLPETGGMGTTLFYIAGGILVLAAVVLLVTKKRMQNAE